MEPIKYPKRRKTVDVPEDAFKHLLIKAATRRIKRNRLNFVSELMG